MGSGSPTSSLGQKDFEKFEKFEQAISEQMDVIEKLTDEKAKVFTELNTALAVIKQMERENATLAFQVKGLLAKRERQTGKNNEPAP